MINRTPLIHADEWLLHQVPRPMVESTVSDHRLYGRHWFFAGPPDGSYGVLFGLGVYRNMNVTDGFIAIQNKQKQYNLRMSRVWRPDTAEMVVGPLKIEIIKPFEHLRITVADNEHGISGCVDFRSTFSPHLEKVHDRVIDHAIHTDMSRYVQAGTMTGFLKLEGERIEVADWWADRNHSWGIRPGIGGWDPIYGDHSKNDPFNGDPMRLYIWSHYSTDEYSFLFSQQEDVDGNVLYSDGDLFYVDDRPCLKMKRLEHDIAFFPGTRAVQRSKYLVTMSDDSTIEIVAEPLMRAWAYSGTGYGRGYFDARGLGAQRGNPPPEYDVYDLSHPEIVRDSSGDEIPSGHREQSVVLTANGRPAIGHFPVMVW